MFSYSNILVVRYIGNLIKKHKIFSRDKKNNLIFLSIGSLTLCPLKINVKVFINRNQIEVYYAFRNFQFIIIL